MRQTLTQQTLADIMVFPFENRNWLKKSLLGMLLILIGPMTFFIPWIFVAGYCYRLIRRVITEDGEMVLPEWSAWDRLFLDGIRVIGAGLIYLSPALLLFIIGFSGLFAFPALLNVASQSNNPLLGIFPVTSLGIGWLFYGTGLFLLFIVGLILPAPLCHLIARDSFTAAFQIDEWWKIFKTNFVGFAISFLFLIGFSTVFYFATQILYFTFIFCFFTPFLMSAYTFYLYIITGLLFAQAYQGGLLKNKIIVLPASSKR